MFDFCWYIELISQLHVVNGLSMSHCNYICDSNLCENVFWYDMICFRYGMTMTWNSQRYGINFIVYYSLTNNWVLTIDLIQFHYLGNLYLISKTFNTEAILVSAFY